MYEPVPPVVRSFPASGSGPLAEIAAALDMIHAGLDALLDVGDRDGWSAVGCAELAAVVGVFEKARNRMSSVDHVIADAAERVALWEMTTSRDAAGAIAEIARISRSEAQARVCAATMLAPEITLGGDRLPARLAKAAAAQRDGVVSPGQAKVILDCVRELQAAVGCGDASRDAEASLVGYCAAFDPRELQKVANRIVAIVVPDGRPPRDELVKARRGITLGAERDDGSCSIRGAVTKALRAKLFTVLSPLAAPHPAAGGIHDGRSAVQRMHDALEDACDRLIRVGDLPGSAGSPASVMVVAQLDDLLAQAESRGRSIMPPARSTSSPSFTTVDGRVISVDELLRIAGEADIIPVFLSRMEGIVAYGRNRRFASPGQWKALIARDVGCSFPGCDVPPQWCQVHHVVPWVAGGKTNLDNLALVCGFHHREFEGRGWTCRMINGMPHWIPPAWVDPDRIPLQNKAHLITPITDAQALAALHAAYQDAEREQEFREMAEQARDRLGPRVAERVNRLLDHDLENSITSWIEDALQRHLPTLDTTIGRAPLDDGEGAQPPG